MPDLKSAFRVLVLSSSCLLGQSVAAEALSLVTGNEYPPFTGSDLAGGGVLTELVRQAFDASGTAIGIDFKPWTRGYEETLRLGYDATFPYLSTPRRTADFLFSEPLYQLSLRLYVRRDSPWQTGSPEEMRNATFCLPAGYEVSGWIRAESDRLVFVRPRSMAQCHAMLQLGRVDVVVSNPDELAWQAVPPKLTLPNVRALPEPLADVTLHLIVPRAHPDAQALLSTFNAGLQGLVSSGARDQLFRSNPEYRRVFDIADH